MERMSEPGRSWPDVTTVFEVVTEHGVTPSAAPTTPDDQSARPAL